MFPNQAVANNGVHAGGTPMSPSQQQNINYNGIQQQRGPQQGQQQPSKSKGKKAYVKITEQPAGKALRFRYECEGRSAGSIPGINSTPENKTYPTIEIVGYKGRAVVVVSCVTKDPPYRPHPHNLVGKEGCKKGVCTVEINSETMRAVFSNLGIQCVKKKDIDAALRAREDIRVDPFKTGFEHRSQPSSIDLNSVRLCFQVFLENEQNGRFTNPLTPVISEPIFDKKAMSDLVICRLCSCSATVLGNTQIILLCEKVAKDDIMVRFFEEKDGKTWEAFGDFQQTDVHKQTAITFRTPRYHKLDITEPAKVFVQLKRPSDGVTSEPLPFEYIPLDSGRTIFWNLHGNLKRKPDLDLFKQISDIDNENKQAHLSEPIEVIDLNTPVAEQQPESSSFIQPQPPVAVATASMETENVSTVSENINDEAAKRRNEHEIDIIIDEKVRELEQQAQLKAAETMDQESSESRQTSATDKINEWMKSNEFTQSTVEDYNNTIESNAVQSTPIVPNDEDKTLNDLLDQVAELDEIYADHVLQRESYNAEIMNEMNSMEINAAVDIADGGESRHFANMETEESFDDAATYTSLQIAFKNPISIPMGDVMPPTPPLSHLAPEDIQHYDPIEVLTSPKPVPSPLKQIPRPVISPHMHVTAAEEEKLPPLPPKRLRKQDSNAENQSIEANIGTNTLDRKSRQQQSPIIIMKTPDQSPPTKRLPPKPGTGSTNTLPKQKKHGFFSKLFSRGKSKPDLSSEAGQNSTPGSKCESKKATPNDSREPSIGNFHMNDSFRASMRSAKSLQPSSAKSSPLKEAKKPKTGKPVGRSVSSVSGKRPARLTADVVHIPLKGDSVNSLPQNEAYSNSSTITLGALDRRTVSALQLAEIPISDGNMELVAIADRQSLRNLCQGEFNVQLDPDVDLTEAEHFALYTSIPPQATASEFDETSAYYAPVDAGEILTPDEIAKRLTAANRID